jgi:hypothetical protein
MKTTTIGTLAFAGVIALNLGQSANAFPMDPVAIRPAANFTSTIQQAQYYEHHARHHVVKCYRELVVGAYVCHHYRYW